MPCRDGQSARCFGQVRPSWISAWSRRPLSCQVGPAGGSRAARPPPLLSAQLWQIGPIRTDLPPSTTECSSMGLSVAHIPSLAALNLAELTAQELRHNEYCMQIAGMQHCGMSLLADNAAICKRPDRFCIMPFQAQMAYRAHCVLH